MGTISVEIDKITECLIDVNTGMIMKKDIDNMTGLYFSVQGNPYSAHPFPFNMKELREYLKKTGKTMKDLTVNEFDMFRVSPIAKAN